MSIPPPHTGYAPRLLTTAELKAERKEIADKFYAAQSEKWKDRVAGEGRAPFLQKVLAPLEACPCCSRR